MDFWIHKPGLPAFCTGKVRYILKKIGPRIVVIEFDKIGFFYINKIWANAKGCVLWQTWNWESVEVDAVSITCWKNHYSQKFTTFPVSSFYFERFISALLEMALKNSALWAIKTIFSSNEIHWTAPSINSSLNLRTWIFKKGIDSCSTSNLGCMQ